MRAGAREPFPPRQPPSRADGRPPGVLVETDDQTKDSFDYIVIGAGSAGCVIANRLSADPRHSVLLIEAGGRDRHPLVQLPMLMAS